MSPPSPSTPPNSSPSSLRVSFPIDNLLTHLSSPPRDLSGKTTPACRTAIHTDVDTALSQTRIAMHKPSATSNISGHHFSLAVAEPLLLFFYKTFLIWATMLQKLSLIRFPARARTDDTCPSTSSSRPVQVPERSPAGEADLGITRQDVETVMQILLGMPGGGDSNEAAADQKKLKEPMGCAELTDMFEEHEPSLAEVKEAFSVFDDNSDGFIDPSELQRVLSKLGFAEGLTLDACEQMIAVHDQNRDGRIDLNEFIKFMETNLS